MLFDFLLVDFLIIYAANINIFIILCNTKYYNYNYFFVMQFCILQKIRRLDKGAGICF